MKTDSLSTGGFPILVGSYLGLDCVPVHLDVLGVLLEFFNVFLLVVLLKESCTVCDYRVHMCLIVNSDVKSAFPSVKLDIHLDCSIEKTSLNKDLLSLIHFLAIHGQGSVSSWLRGKFLNVVDELDLIRFIYRGECNFHSIQFSAVDTHGG